jgi:hypothetical protein
MSDHPSFRRTRRYARAARDVVPETLESRRLMAVNLFFEDFDALPLKPFVSGSEGGGSGSDWTADLPAGWTRDNTTTPEGGPVEFLGFTFLNKDSWIATEGNQDRNLFTRGNGTVMVSDPDAYDDMGEIDPNLYNVFIRTPPIPLANVVPGTVTLSFDNSFRPYDTMTASVEVSFDNGTNWTSLLSMNSANVPGGDSSLERVNEAVSLPLNNPAGATSAIVRYGMTEAGNDWWWAVDNIAVNATLDVPGVKLVGATGSGGEEGGANTANDETLFNVAFANNPVTTTKILKLPHVPDADAVGFNPTSGLLHHVSGGESTSDEPAAPTYRDNQFMETVDVVAGSNAQQAVFNANSEQFGPAAPRPTFVQPATRRTDTQTDGSFRVRGPNEYHAARDLTWSAAANAFYVTDENGLFKLTADGQSTFVGNPNLPSGGVSGLAFAVVDGRPRMIVAERNGSELFLLDPTTGDTVGEAIPLADAGGNPIPGVLSLVTHPNTGDVYALARSATAPDDPLQRDLIKIDFAGAPLAATGTRLGTFTGLPMTDLAFVYQTASAAQVSEVYVRGSAWSAAFKTYMEGQNLGDDLYGYRVDNKAAADVAPWINLDEIVLRFSAAPTGSGIPTPGTLVLDGVRSDYNVTNVTAVDPQTYVLRLDRPLGNLPTPPGGNNGDRIKLTVPAAGPSGAAYTRTINVLQGDTDKSGSVVANDFSDVKKKFFRSTSAPGSGDTGYTVFHDVDGSGQIVANDFSEVKNRFFDNLPAASAGALAPALGPSITQSLFATRSILT